MNPKIEQALALLTGCPASDFAELAVLAADQAGMSLAMQHDLRRDLALECARCARPSEGYTIVSMSGASIGPLCEECHDSVVASGRRQKHEAIEEGRGDYMRDQRKDG